MKKMVIVLILLDAFRWDYVNPKNTPTLWNIAHNGLYVRKLRPNLGFCERSEIFTGTRPELNNNFTAIAYNPQNSQFFPYRNILKILSCFDKVKKSKYRRFIRQRVFNFSRSLGITQPIYEIPLELLSFFSLTEDLKPHTNQGAFHVESIFDVMKQYNKTFFYDSFTSLTMHSGTDEDRLQRAIYSVDSMFNLYLVYLGGCDSAGHKNGPNSVECRKMIREQDDRVCRLRNAFLKKSDNVNFVVVGDHGMVEVEHYIDFANIINRIVTKRRLKSVKDFIMFLDSTLVRFYFFSSKAQRVISEIFRDVEITAYGDVITGELASKFKIPAPGAYYGNLIWLAKPGIMIYPDYFNRKAPKGMHGYITNIDAQKGFAIISSSKTQNITIDEAELIDICPTLCCLLDIPAPENNQGKNLLEF